MPLDFRAASATRCLNDRARPGRAGSKHSGLHSRCYLASQFGIEVSEAVMEEALEALKRHTYANGAPSPEQAGEILMSVAAGRGAQPIPSPRPVSRRAWYHHLDSGYWLAQHRRR
jgi:hypothetical protein